MTFKTIISLFVTLSFFVGCLGKDSAYDDPDFRAAHTNLRFCADEEGIRDNPVVRVFAHMQTETIELQKEGDAYCGRLKAILFSPESHAVLRIEPRNHAATFLSSLEVRYPVLNEKGALVATSIRLTRRAESGDFRVIIMTPYKDVPHIMPQPIPSARTNDFF